MSHVLGKFYSPWPPHAAGPEPFSRIALKILALQPLWECQLVREILSSELELMTPICQ